MTAFIQGTESVGISGGNFRQTSYNEQHEHHTRVFQDDRTVIQGNIYGYTHNATSDDGPIIAYSHHTSFRGPYHDEHLSRSLRGRGDPIPARKICHGDEVHRNSYTPLAVDEGAEQISRTRGLAGKLLLLRH